MTTTSPLHHHSQPTKPLTIPENITITVTILHAPSHARFYRPPSTPAALPAPEPLILSEKPGETPSWQLVNESLTLPASTTLLQFSSLLAAKLSLPSEYHGGFLPAAFSPWSAVYAIDGANSIGVPAIGCEGPDIVTLGDVYKDVVTVQYPQYWSNVPDPVADLEKYGSVLLDLATMPRVLRLAQERAFMNMRKWRALKYGVGYLERRVARLEKMGGVQAGQRGMDEAGEGRGEVQGELQQVRESLERARHDLQKKTREIWWSAWVLRKLVRIPGVSDGGADFSYEEGLSSFHDADAWFQAFREYFTNAAKAMQPPQPPLDQPPTEAERSAAPCKPLAQDVSEKDVQRDIQRQSPTVDSNHSSVADDTNANKISLLPRDLSPSSSFTVTSGVLLWGQLHTVLAGSVSPTLDTTAASISPALSSGTIIQRPFQYRAPARRGLWHLRRVYTQRYDDSSPYYRDLGVVDVHLGWIIYHHETDPLQALRRANAVGISNGNAQVDKEVVYVNRYDWSYTAPARVEPLMRQALASEQLGFVEQGRGEDEVPDGEREEERANPAWRHGCFMAVDQGRFGREVVKAIMDGVKGGFGQRDMKECLLTDNKTEPFGAFVRLPRTEYELGWMIFDEGEGEGEGRNELVAMVYDGIYHGLDAWDYRVEGVGEEQ